MLVSHKYEFIFTKTHKTAGTSVESFFERYCMPENEWCLRDARPMYVGEEGIIGSRGKVPGYTQHQFRNHMPAAEVKASIGRETWDRYFKFTVIRDPFDVLVSSYYHYRFKTLKQGRKAKNRSFALHYASHLLSALGCDRLAVTIDVPLFRRWLRDVERTDRSVYTIDGAVCMDYFIRYEQLLDGVTDVCNRLGIEFDEGSLPSLKSGYRNKKIALSRFYDAEAIGHVKKLYDFELEYFRYLPPK